MLDIRLIREDPDRVKRAMKTRNKDMDAVVDEIKASIFRNVRMRIRFTRNSMRSPTRVSDAGSSLYVSRYFVL